MRSTWKAFLLLLALALGVCAPASAQYFSPEDIQLTLPPGSFLAQGTWIGGETEEAYLLLGNEEEQVMQLAVARRDAEGQYSLTACSKAVLPLADYREGISEMLDHWDDGHPYFYFHLPNTYTLYLQIGQRDTEPWQVSSGYIEFPETWEQRCFYLSETPGVIQVYETISPQICWPISHSMALEGFDLKQVNGELVEALGYLKEFNLTHSFGEQDEVYTIVWE